MRAHVQERGCIALLGLIDNAGNKVKAGWWAGGIEAVMAAMRAHSSNLDVQERGEAALLEHVALPQNFLHYTWSGAVTVGKRTRKLCLVAQ